MDNKQAFAQDNTFCQSDKMTSFLHELNQSLVVIQAYVNGCTERLEENNLSHEQLQTTLLKIKQHTELLGAKIHRFSLSESLPIES